MEKFYTFILNPIEIDGDLPVEIIPGHFFDKANQIRVDKIREILRQHSPSDFDPSYLYEYKSIITPLDNPNHTNYTHQKLPFSKWRYWILYSEKNFKEIEKLQYAANLIPNDLSFGFTVFEEGSYKGGYAGNAYELTHYMGDAISLLMESPKTLKTEELELIGKYHNLINSLDPEFQPIHIALQSFQHLKYIPDFSYLKIIGYFSIIESLITHAPKISGSDDSITHQIKTKIPLLQRRFDREIDYSKFFHEGGRP